MMHACWQPTDSQACLLAPLVVLMCSYDECWQPLLVNPSAARTCCEIILSSNICNAGLVALQQGTGADAASTDDALQYIQGEFLGVAQGQPAASNLDGQVC